MAKTSAPGPIKRTLTIDPYAIMSLIKAQAGSIAKAMLEAVANSMDANATKIDVTLQADRILIKDNGRGLTQEQEIYDFFERFGFDHSKLDRKVGRFGVGRGQLFCFGVNTWRTNTFQMGIDIKKDGLDYELDLNKPKAKGMAIDIALYETLRASEMLEVEEEFCRLVKFCIVPVFLNGKQVSTDPRKEKWAHETDEAWFRIRKDGRLQIYSQGLYIKDAYSFGVGGVIVSKPGKAIAQNLARNDILVKECDIWKAMEPTIRKLAAPFKEKIHKATMTDDMRRALVKEAMVPTGLKTLMAEPLFTLTTRKHLNLKKLLGSGYLSQAKAYDHAADKLMQNKQAMVLDVSTLERFNVDTVAELVQKLRKVFKAQKDYNDSLDYRHPEKVWEYSLREIETKLEALVTTECTQDLPFEPVLPFTEVSARKISDKEKIVLMALRRQMNTIGWQVLNHSCDENDRSSIYAIYEGSNRYKRALKLCEDGSGMLACTDGTANVWLNRAYMMKMAKQGLPGFVSLMNLLVHEYVHSEGSMVNHGHPPEFFEVYHDTLLYGDVATAALSAYSMVVKYGLETTARTVSTLEKTGVTVDTPVGLGLAAFEADFSTERVMGDEEEDPVAMAAAIAKPEALSKARAKTGRRKAVTATQEA